MKFQPGATTNEGWGGRGNSASPSGLGSSDQYTAGVATAPPPKLALRMHNQKRYPAGSTAHVVGPYSVGQTINRVT